MYARFRQKPLWKLVVDMTPVSLWRGTECCEVNVAQEELVNSATFRYITDAITKEEALQILKAREATKAERENTVRELG